MHPAFVNYLDEANSYLEEGRDQLATAQRNLARYGEQLSPSRGPSLLTFLLVIGGGLLGWYLYKKS